MIPLVDLHCHLLAGVDDGPRTDVDALEMCRIACNEGVRLASALAHQNERWSAVTPSLIREHARRLTEALRAADLPLTVFPSAEVMVHPEIEASWRRGDLLSVADRGQYLLVEMPHNLFIDLCEISKDLCQAGVRPIIAHPERHPELLHDPGRIEQFIQAGCLVQVSSSSITDPDSSKDARALKDWFKRGIVHFLGSDGHSPRRRRPHMADAYHQIARWAGAGVADRVCSTNATAVVHGLPLRFPPPQPQRTHWFSRFW
jgi:protein-tyrosine phosphatase